MTTKYRKKLIEVAIPLEAINEASAREKSIRHGHPSTLHLWWARRPLAACRAVLFAQLVDDPSSHPDKFPNDEAVEAERKRLFGIIEELVIWENLNNEEVLERARTEIRKSCGGKLPPIYDPFSGGGSIPLEAQRLGLPAYGSDLNPVAVMIGKAMVEIPPRFKDMPPIHPGAKERQFYYNAEGLAEDVKYYGEWMRKEAWERIGHLYPQVDLPKKHGGGKAAVIAWIWARTVPSPDPAFSDVQVPLVSSFILSTKKGKEVWIKPVVDKVNKEVTYEVRHGGTKDKIARAKSGTKAGRGAHFVCLLSGAAMTPDYIREAANSGQMQHSLIAICAEGKGSRCYVAPDTHHIKVARSAVPTWKPEQEMNQKCRDLVSGRGYGFKYWHQLFTDRQLVALSTFSDLTKEIRSQIEADAILFQANMVQESSLAYGEGRLVTASSNSAPLRDNGAGIKAYSEAVSIYLNFAVSKLANLGSTITGWMSDRGALRETFARQVIPMVWDYAEANFFSNSGGNWSTHIDKICKAISKFPARGVSSIKQLDACEVIYEPGTVISSDPPYYDNIGYADLSDFFFFWMKPGLRDIYPEIFSVLATPKKEELVATSYRHGSKDAAEQFFLTRMTAAIGKMAYESTKFPVAIYYAFKQSEVEQEGISSTGWATFLQSVISAGFSVLGTWPIRTESPGRLIARGTNALASSVVLVCRKREATAEIATRAEFLRILRLELPPAIEQLKASNISPADMPQSAIGPGMGIFSRYKAVLEADDSPMPVKTALQLINVALDEFLNDLQGEFDADTRFAITWFEQHGNEKGDYGVADNLARARGISVESVKHAGIIESTAGKVRILQRSEIDAGWNPADDDHITVWECCQHLIRVLENEGEHNAAVLLKRIGSDRADAVKDLAYYLYDVCSNKRQDPKEATAYNGLISIWSELTREAAAIRDVSIDQQETFDI